MYNCGPRGGDAVPPAASTHWVGMLSGNTGILLTPTTALSLSGGFMAGETRQ